MERLEASPTGHVEVAGRWFGVRGRRFVRPTLTFASRQEGEGRALADLAHKPWAAQDGDEWMAAFSVDTDLSKATSIELSVAPDINIILRAPTDEGPAVGETLLAARRASITDRSRRRGSGTGGRVRPSALSAPSADDDAGASSSKSTTSAPSGSTNAAKGSAKAPAKSSAKGGAKSAAQKPAEAPSADAPAEAAARSGPGPEVVHEIGRLRGRLKDAGEALEAERQKRASVDRTLDEERAAHRRMQAELAQLRADVELARAAEQEAAETAKQLDAARKQLEAAAERRRALEAERDRALEAQSAARTALEERTEALEATREALADERAETGRLHNRAKGLQDAREAAEARATAAMRDAAEARAHARTGPTQIGPARSRDATDEDPTVATASPALEETTATGATGRNASRRDADIDRRNADPGRDTGRPDADESSHGGRSDADAGQDTRSFTVAEAAELLDPEAPEPPRAARTAPAMAGQAWERIAGAVLSGDDDDSHDAATRRPAAGQRRTVQISGDSGQFRQPAPHHGTPPPDRPLNPSLHTNEWIPRLLAVLVLVVIVVVLLLLIGSGGH